MYVGRHGTTGAEVSAPHLTSPVNQREQLSELQAFPSGGSSRRTAKDTPRRYLIGHLARATGMPPFFSTFQHPRFPTFASFVFGAFRDRLPHTRHTHTPHPSYQGGETRHSFHRRDPTPEPRLFSHCPGCYPI